MPDPQLDLGAISEMLPSVPTAQPVDPVSLLGGGDESTEHIQDAEDRLKEEQEEQAGVQYNLSKEEKAKIVAHIKQLINDCNAGRTEWRANLDEAIDLYEGVRAPKSDPWPNCSNVTTRITATHTKLMHSKLFPAVWNENLIHWQPMEKSDAEGADAVNKFMNWVIRQELKLGDTVDDTLHDLVTYGTIAMKVRWDTEYRNIRDKDSSAGYKKIARQKVYIDNIPIDNVYIPNEWHGENESAYIGQDIFMRLPDIAADKIRGHFVHDAEDTNKIEAYIDTLIPDNIQQKKKETTGLAEYMGIRDNKILRLIEIEMPWEINGEIIDSVFTIAHDADVFLSGKPLTAVSPTGDSSWIIGQFMRRSGIPYGDGLPELMKGLAAELDAIHNQRIDAGSITISPFGFYRAASAFNPETVQVGPGVFIPVDDINDAKIVQFPANGLATSYQEERIIIEYIEKLTATSAYQMGRESDVVKSRATATGTMAIISQGEQAYTLLGLRAQRIYSRLLNKILATYQCFMPTGLVDRVLGPDDAPLFPQGLSKEELVGNYDALMTLDQTAGSKQMERQVSATLIRMAPNLLAISRDPRGYRMAEDFLKSMGKIDVERYLGPKPKEGQQPTAEGLANFGGLPVGPGGGEQGVPQL